jgi:hypothetical protein
MSDMKIIDEKGSIFGRINAIDFSVILLLLCILPAFYFGYKVMTRKVEIPVKEYVNAEIECRFIKLRPDVLRLISVGDKDLDIRGEKMGEIIRLGRENPYFYTFNMGEGEEFVFEKEKVSLKEMNARLRLKTEVGDPGDNHLYYKGQAIQVGSIIDFNTDKYNCEVMVLKGREISEDRIVTLPVIFADLDETMLKNIFVGDREVNAMGSTIAEILELGEVEESALKIDLGEDNFVMSERSKKKQIYAKMRLSCESKLGQKIYFKSKVLRHDTTFRFITDRYAVNAMVRLPKLFKKMI